MKRRSDEEISAPLYEYDAAIRAQYGFFAGVDEAGRGPLCGPVVVAACILDPEKPVYGINDSKKLTEKKREALFEQIIEKALGAEIAAFGNRIRISGDEEAVRQAKNAVDALYSKVSRGIAVGEQEVLAAVRISGAEANVKPQVNIDDIVLKTKKRHIYPRSATQAEYIVEMMNNELVFGLGPAGTGKTYLAVALAVTMMLEGSIDKIILSRPAVEAGENLGFLPGDLKDKVDPYLRPLYDALYEMLPAEQVDKKLAAGEIEIAPLAFMRGRTLSNAFVILDEAQNTTPMQMKMFLTRLGENSRMVVNGDLSQVDLPRGVVSGLRDALDTLRGVGGISSVTFSAADVVRHGLVAKIVRAYEQKYHREEKKKDENDA